MDTTKTLPKFTKKKKIDLKKFVSLAKKVRKVFEEEQEYLEKKIKRDGNNNSTGFLPNF